MFTNLAILNRAPRRLFANSSYESWRSSPISQTDLTLCSSLKALTFWDTWQWQAFARHWDGSKSVKSWDTVHQNHNSHNKKCRKILCLPFHNGIQASLLSTFNSPILWKKMWVHWIHIQIGQLCSGWLWKSCGKSSEKNIFSSYAWKKYTLFGKPEKCQFLYVQGDTNNDVFLTIEKGLTCRLFLGDWFALFSVPTFE